MVKELSQLNDFITQSVKPDRLANTELTDRDFNKWSEFIKKATHSLQVYIDDALDILSPKTARRLLPLLNGLIAMINVANSYSKCSICRDHPSARKIQSFYKFTCEKMEQLLMPLYTNAFFKRMCVSDFAKPDIKMELKGYHKRLSKALVGIPQGEELAVLVLNVLGQRIQKKDITWREVQEINHAFSQLLAAELIDKYVFMEVLIATDFNFPEFFLYCVHLWRSKLIELADFRTQIEYVVREKQWVYEIALTSASEKKKLKNNQIGTDLTTYLDEQQRFLMQLLELQRAAMLDEAQSKSSERFPVGLSVPQFGLFIRLQMERGILPKENVGQLFAFFAAHFYTSNALFMSAESLQKKSTDIEFATAQKMKAQLIGMLNWLNTNYNLSNYS